MNFRSREQWQGQPQSQNFMIWYFKFFFSCNWHHSRN